VIVVTLTGAIQLSDSTVFQCRTIPIAYLNGLAIKQSLLSVAVVIDITFDHSQSNAAVNDKILPHTLFFSHYN